MNSLKISAQGKVKVVRDFILMAAIYALIGLGFELMIEVKELLLEHLVFL